MVLFLYVKSFSRTEKLSTLGAREMVPGYRQKIVSRSHLELHGYSISPLFDAILKLELSREYKAVDYSQRRSERLPTVHCDCVSYKMAEFLLARRVLTITPELTKRCGHRDPVPAFVPEGSSDTGALYPSSSVCT